jgi:hypothetical protein
LSHAIYVRKTLSVTASWWHHPSHIHKIGAYADSHGERGGTKGGKTETAECCVTGRPGKPSRNGMQCGLTPAS